MSTAAPGSDPGPAPDGDLVTRASSGDRQALDVLFARHQERLLFLVRQRLGPGLRAKLESGDILLSAFLDALRVWTSAPRREAEFLPWIAAVIEGTIRDRVRWFRRRKRDAAREVPLAPSDPPAPRTSSPSEAAVRAEDLRTLERALHRLNASDRRLVLWSRVEGLSTVEIAAHLGKSREAAKRSVTRALARLAVAIRSCGPG